MRQYNTLAVAVLTAAVLSVPAYTFAKGTMAESTDCSHLNKMSVIDTQGRSMGEFVDFQRNAKTGHIEAIIIKERPLSKEKSASFMDSTKNFFSPRSGEDDVENPTLQGVNENVGE